MRLSVGAAADLFDDHTYSNACTSLAYVDIEQRRLDRAAELLSSSLALSVERDVHIDRTWLLAMRSRLQLLTGEWTTRSRTQPLSSKAPPHH